MIDVRHLRSGVRVAARSRLVSLGAIVCVALGIGATTALFGVLDRIVLRPVLYPDARALVLIRTANRAKGIADAHVSFEEFTAWRQGAPRSFDTLVAFQAATVSLSGTALPERLDAARVSDGFFETCA